MKGILFRAGGGLGKNIMATAVVRQIRKANPELPIHVQTNHPDAFVELDEVTRVYPLVPNPDFHDLHRDFEILETEPYQAHGYRRDGEHLVAAWCRRLGLKPPSSPAGTIRVNRFERRAAEQILGQIRQQAAGRKVVAFQWIGSSATVATQIRELPQATAQEIVDELAKNQCFPVVIGLPTEPRLQNCLTLLAGDGQAFSPRIIFAVLASVDGLIAIDSFAQHAWAALGKSNALVLWGATRPENLGYESNVNVKPPANCCPTPGCNRPETHLGDWVGNGNVWTCPHEGACMNYNAQDVVKRFMKAMNMAPPVPAPAPVKNDEPAAAPAAEETKEVTA